MDRRPLFVFLLAGSTLSLASLGAGACGNSAGNQRAAAPAASVAPAVQAAPSRAPATPATAASIVRTVLPTVAATTPATVRSAAAPGPVPVVAREYAFDAPATVPAGQVTFSMSNTGAQTHEMVVVRLNALTPEQYRDALANPSGSPPAVTQLRGVAATKAGSTGEVTLDLTPGTYGLACFLKEPDSAKTHAELGMVGSFTVR